MALPLPGTPIIVDIGSAYVKVGFAGESGPRFVFPCITGTEKYKSVMVDVSGRSMYVGNDVSRMRGVLKISHPIQRGSIMNWDSFFEILNYIFYTLLRVESLSEYPVFYCESPFMHRETKEYIARLLFETHGVRSLIMIPTPLLSMFSVGLTTGLVIESGDGLTWVAPIINGVMQDHAVQKVSLAGIDVNHNLKNLLMREGVNITSSAADEIIQDIKEKNCYFVLDPNDPPKTGEKFSVPMPDGSTISIASYVLYQAPEVLFDPSMLGVSNVMNLSEAVLASLKVLDNQYWHELLSHIVFSGGNLSYSGFEQRFQSELNAVLRQLGSIPRPKPTLSTVKTELIKLQAVDKSKKQQDTCSQCGEMLDLSTGIEYCPSCGGRLSLPEIKIDLSSRNEIVGSKKKKGKCPYCKKEIQDATSLFCPYCGRSVETFEKPKISEEKKPAQEFVEYMESSSKVIKFFIPDNFQFAIFNGAAILGSLPSFQNLFITHEQFQSNSDLLYRDISEIL